MGSEKKEHRLKKLALIAILLIIVSCFGPIRSGRHIPDGPVSYQTILGGSHSLVDTSLVELITNEDDWENTWLLACGGIEPLPARPEVDFGHQYVIAAYMGKRFSSGYKIEISSILKQGNDLLVTVKRYETAGMLPVVTTPFSLVRIPRGSYKLKVIEESVR